MPTFVVQIWSWPTHIVLVMSNQRLVRVQANYHCTAVMFFIIKLICNKDCLHSQDIHCCDSSTATCIHSRFASEINNTRILSHVRWVDVRKIFFSDFTATLKTKGRMSVQRSAKIPAPCVESIDVP